MRAKRAWKSISTLSLDAAEQAYQEAVQGGQHLMDPQRCQNHGPVRLLVPLLEFNPYRLNPHPFNLAKTHFVAAPVVEFRRFDVRVTCHPLGDVNVAAAFQIVRDTDGLLPSHMHRRATWTVRTTYPSAAFLRGTGKRIRAVPPTVNLCRVSEVLGCSDRDPGCARQLYPG